MRRGGSRREKIVGVVILLILGGIGLSVTAVSLRHERPLFEPTPETRAAQAAAMVGHDLHVARSMMPPLGTAGWVRDEAITVQSGAELDEALSSAGVVRVYAGRYADRRDPAQFVEVSIHETKAPPYAFALAAQRRPANASPLGAGNGGWMEGNRAGFWAGRYYTEFDRSAVRAEQPNVTVITDALAGVQIAYGPPFWAEDVLPAEGQVAGSFRFAPAGEMVLPILRDCFAATYGGGTIALATRAGSPAQAEQLLSKIGGQLQRDGDSAGGSSEAAMLSGTFDGKVVCAFVVGDTVGATVGADAGSASRLAAEIVSRLRPAGAVAAAAVSTQRQSAETFPPIDLPGWRAPENVRVFSATNLWEKIDGRADLYLTYNVAGLTFGTYRSESGAGLDVYWYDMTAVDNAFGIFQAELGEHGEPVAIGRAGYRVGAGVFFWKGAHYVRVEAAEESEEIAAASEAVAKAIAERVPDDGARLWADALLPEEDRRPDSFEYHGQSAFGLDFLAQVFAAEYEPSTTGAEGSSAGKTYTVFIHRAPNPDRAKETFRAYIQFFEDYGKVLQSGGVEGADLLVGESSGVLDAVFVSGRYVGGVNGAKDEALARERAEAFRARVAAFESP